MRFGFKKTNQELRTANRGEIGVEAEFAASAEAKWAARLVGAGSLLTLLYQVAYLVLDRPFLSLHYPWVLILHSINIGLFGAAVLMTVKVGPWMKLHWKAVAFAFSAVMIATCTAIAVMTGQTQPFFIALMLFLAGTGPFLSWGEKIQTLLCVIAAAAFGVALSLLPHSAFDPYDVLGLLIAAAIGLLTTALERRLRRARRHAEAEVLKGREQLLLQERLRLAGQLASGMAHDLNNTLNILRLRLSALFEDEMVDSRHHARLQAVERALEDAARTVARVRELGQTRNLRGEEPVQLHEVVAQAIELARSSIEGRPALMGADIRITSELPMRLPPITGTAADLRQVLLNLLLNAADALGQQGEIRIDSTVEDSAVIIRVSDNGSGIPQEHIARIFEPFYTTKGPHGSGLGLSTAREVMESFGGNISAANRAEGGAVFVLRFPLADPARHSGHAHTPFTARPGRRFLIIDDNAESLESLAEVLVRDGHQVDSVHSGQEAVGRMKSGPPYDIILCDLGMPGMNGWEVAAAARHFAPAAAFYILTGWGSEAEDRIPAAVDIAGVLSKPLDINELRRIAAGSAGGAQQLNFAVG